MRPAAAETSGAAGTPCDCLPCAGPYLARAPARRLMTDIESPCNKVCVVDPASGLCIGCGRNLAEIAGWIGFCADERARIMAELPERLAAVALSDPGRALRG
jgi:uncharacterized protein